MTVRLNASHPLPAGDLVVARGVAPGAAMGGVRPARRPAKSRRLEAGLIRGRQLCGDRNMQVEGVVRTG